MVCRKYSACCRPYTRLLKYPPHRWPKSFPHHTYAFVPDFPWQAGVATCFEHLRVSLVDRSVLKEARSGFAPLSNQGSRRAHPPRSGACSLFQGKGDVFCMGYGDLNTPEYPGEKVNNTVQTKHRCPRVEEGIDLEIVSLGQRPAN